MSIKPIKNDDNYEKALDKVETLISAKAGSIEADELEVLSILIEDYENKHHKIYPPNPIDAILFRMECIGREVKKI